MTAEHGNLKGEAASRTSREIARKARERIEHLRSCVHGARSTFHASPEEPGDIDRMIVISDLHFGDVHGLLVDERAIRDLSEAISGMGRVDELVLLGDVFDFWQSPFAEAVAQAKDCMAALFALQNVGRIVYLVGNHDHHVFRMWHESEATTRLMAGDLEPPPLAIPLSPGGPVFEPLKPAGSAVPLFTAYPAYRARVRGKVVLLTHGHVLGFFERSLWAPSQSRVSSLVMNKPGRLDLDDMERFMAPFYEMTALSTQVPRVVEDRHWLYRLAEKTSRFWDVSSDTRTSTYRGNPIEKCAVEIEALLDHFCEDAPDYFVYGHTHKPGVLRLPLSGTTAVNSGCWLGGLNRPEDRRTVVEISDRARIIRVD